MADIHDDMAQWLRSGPQWGKQVLCSPQCLRCRDDAVCVACEPGRRLAVAHDARHVIAVFGHVRRNDGGVPVSTPLGARSCLTVVFVSSGEGGG